jgi:hypothetical protein
VELRTYTSLWTVEKRLYKINDFTLPVPVGVRQLGAFMGSSAVWWTFLHLVGFPLHAPWHIVWAVVPALVAYWAGKPVVEGKRMGELILSQARYARQSREYARLAACTAPRAARARTAVWVATNQPVPDPAGPPADVEDLPAPAADDRTAAGLIPRPTAPQHDTPFARTAP